MNVQYNNYKDEFGDPTFYIQNISDGVVSVSDLGIAIQPFAAEDLREFFDINDLKKSPGLRQGLSQSTKFLKRLTKSEFERIKQEQVKREALAKELKKKAMNVSLTDEKGNIKEVKADISPKTKSMVEKLKLFYAKETRDKGLSPDQFLLWLQTYSLTNDEKEYMLSVIGDKNVREHLYQKLTNKESKKSEENTDAKEIESGGGKEDKNVDRPTGQEEVNFS